MKKNLLFAGLLIWSGLGLAQMSADIEPYTTVHDHLNYERGLHKINLPGLNMDKVNEEDSNGKDGSLYLISRFQEVGMNLETGGSWMDVPGGKLWRIQITTSGALATSLYYDDFFLPEGSIMHVYNHDKSEVIGAFTSKNNKDYKTFATGVVHGETAIIEYFEPDFVSGQGRISIEKIAHYYRGIEPLNSELRGSDPCQVDVACPEGDNWGPQIDATVRILVVSGSGSGWCSGSVMNNTNQDCAPYILTAFHCGSSSSAANFNNYVFYFKRQKANCGSGVVNQSSATGCTKRSASNDGGGGTNGSDYLLVELDNPIPLTYNAYYAGWNKANVGSPSGVSTHHPSGDVKKISTYTSTLLSTNWSGSTPGTHWRVVWSGTVSGHGVTEGGSSGSPIWDVDGYHVGQLTGGGSFCTATSQPDAYGKMSYNWDSNNNPTGGHLKTWLDPSNSMTGNTFGGTYAPCINSVEETVFNYKSNIYPNPSTGMFTIEFTETLNNVSIEVYSSIGVLVDKIDMSNRYNSIIDLSNQANGMYYVTMRSGGVSVTKKIQLIK